MFPFEFANNVFHREIQERYLPPSSIEALKKLQLSDGEVPQNLANQIASAVRKWAIERGAIYYTHWFQPFDGVNAEKRITLLPASLDGMVYSSFSGKELTETEFDASSFPCGGLRSTFKGRGKAKWDPTSPMFVRDMTLYIPASFYTFDGYSLDERSALLKSMHLLNKASIKLMRLLGYDDVKHIYPTVGIEQEFFLLDRNLCSRREDLIHTGRTLIGAYCELETKKERQYCSGICKRILDFLNQVNGELWKLGIMVEAVHHEAAPCQYEIAPHFAVANIACDQNRLLTDLLKSCAPEYGLTATLHEKPFKGMNGSGKHCNWSLLTDTGENLLSFKKDEFHGERNLFFLLAFIRGIDVYQDAILGSALNYSNDLRLGECEAPPCALSICLGERIEQKVLTGSEDIAPSHLIDLLIKDEPERNRTSPIGYTGGKFEFRLPGASQSVTLINSFINTAVADSLFHFCDLLEASSDPKMVLMDILREIREEHAKILFSGDCYTDFWRTEIGKRGLISCHCSLDACSIYLGEEHYKKIAEYGIYAPKELLALSKVKSEEYLKCILLEAKIFCRMAEDIYLSSALKYIAEISRLFESDPLADMYEAEKSQELIWLKEHIQTLKEICDSIKKLCPTLKNTSREQIPSLVERLREQYLGGRAICEEIEGRIPKE